MQQVVLWLPIGTGKTLKKSRNPRWQKTWTSLVLVQQRLSSLKLPQLVVPQYTVRKNPTEIIVQTNKTLLCLAGAREATEKYILSEKTRDPAIHLSAVQAYSTSIFFGVNLRNLPKLPSSLTHKESFNVSYAQEWCSPGFSILCHKSWRRKILTMIPALLEESIRRERDRLRARMGFGWNLCTAPQDGRMEMARQCCHFACTVQTT